MDDDQQLCGTEGQVQELPYEESLQIGEDPETQSDCLTEKQYDNILEMLGKIRLLLEETTANYARCIVEIRSTQEFSGVSVEFYQS